MIAYTTQSNYWRDIFSTVAESWKKLKTLNMFSSFIVCKNQNRSALVRDFFSNTRDVFSCS